ncbi:MAG: hypothetical protein RL573_1500 [Actinomycetota bacterium]
MATMTSLEVTDATAAVIGELGARYMLHPETMAVGTEAKYANGFAWYVTGRGGVLGDVDADVVTSAFGFFGGGLIRKMWETGLQTESARDAGRRYAGACAEFGRRRLQGVAGLERFSELAEKAMDSVDLSGLALFAALRAEPAPGDAAGRAYWNISLLREWRGSEHIIAVRANGFTPAQAVLTGYKDLATGVAEAAKRGFGEGHPDAAPLMARRAAIDAMTSQLQAAGFDALSGEERAEYASLVTVLKDALDANK